MRYVGNKTRLAKQLLPIILKDDDGNSDYVEPFVGACGMMSSVNRMWRRGYDSNKYIIALWKAVQNGWVPPQTLSREEYDDIKTNKDRYHNHLVGFVGFGCSFGSKWFGGYASSGGRNHCGESHRNVLKMSPHISGVLFGCSDYKDIVLNKRSIVYCDPPYQKTLGYAGATFNPDEFWTWCRKLAVDGHRVFVSEYSAPPDFRCVFERSVNVSVARSVCKKAVERLFVPVI